MSERTPDGLAAARARGRTGGQKPKLGPWVGLQTGVTLGFAFVVWLWSQALYSIHILCPLCMTVWAVTIPLVVWVPARNITHGTLKVPSDVGRVVADPGWIITALLYGTVMASIFFAFIQVYARTSGF